MTSFKPKHIAVISLWAEDVPTAVHFYRDVVGLRLVPHHDHPPALDLENGSYLVINRGQPIPAQNTESPQFPLIVFTVEDLESAIEHLEVHGVALPWGVEIGENSRWVKFWDPAGNLIEFVQFIMPFQH
jgi:catechol 2,3-dioxygenase-like lactoylglutathione lyase family enzyme